MRRPPLRGFSSLAAAVGMALSCHAAAQVVTDGTLGVGGPLAGPNYAITPNLGRQVGSNLFHSFSAFNLTSAESATFSGPAGVSNILNRVTGTTASSIDGLLRSTIAGANLFLINPKGILFGPNARLDLTGSFHASTANYIRLADGGRFDATNPGTSVLTSAPPAAFGFLGPTPAPITVQGSNLSVPEGGSLSLVGGAINLFDATLRTVAGDIRLVAMGGAGEVPVNATGASLAGMTLAPITVERSTLETTSGTAAAPGRLVIRGGQITVLDSNLSSTNHGPVAAPPVELAASGDLTISASRITSSTDGAGRGADLAFNGKNITLDRDTQVVSDTSGSAPGGDIALTAANAFRLIAEPDVPTFTTALAQSSGTGSAGGINVSADTVLIEFGNLWSFNFGSGHAAPIRVRGRTVDITEAAWVWTPTWASGRSADIDIAATERIFVRDTLPGWGWASVFTETNSTGNAGDITFRAPEIRTMGARIDSITYGTGNGAGNAGSLFFTGDVIRFAGDFAGLVIGSGTSQFTTGNGGRMEIRATREFELSGSAPGAAWTRIANATQGFGNSDVIIIESPTITIDRALVFSRTRWGTGDLGGIILRGDDVRVQNYGQIVSRTEGERNGSLILIEARSFHISDSSHVAASTDSSGNAGRITINAQRVKMTGGSLIQADSNGTGNAGDITINASESFEMSERAPSLTADFFFPRQVLSWPGGLSTTATAGGNAGSIVVRAPNILLDDGRILSTAVKSGQGGRVELHADSLTMRSGAQIDARSASGSTGNAGSIDINVSGGFEILGLSPIDGVFSGLFAETQGSGRGGNIGIAANTLFLDRSLIRSSTGGSGSGGTIRIRANQVVLDNGAWIDAGTAAGSTGAGGSVDLNAAQSLIVRGMDRNPITRSRYEIEGLEITPGRSGRAQSVFPSTISSNTDGAAAGGNVTLSAPQITIADGGHVSANSSATGTAGNIFIQAPEWLRLYGGSISTQALTGDGGNIDIRAGNMVRLVNSEISTSVGGGEGSGGNIFIDPTFVLLEHSRVTANAFGGAGGNIDIIAGVFLASPDSVIEASSLLGVSGRVQIAATDTNPSAALSLLPATYLDASSLLRNSCVARGGPRASSFIGVGRGGVADSPEGFSSSRYFADGRPPFVAAGGDAPAAGPTKAAAAALARLPASACERGS